LKHLKVDTVVHFMLKGFTWQSSCDTKNR
jgi:hypothetical protein